MLPAALLERWPQVCRVKITCTKLPTNRFVSTTKIPMKYVVNWIPLRIRVRSRNSDPHIKVGPEPLENEINQISGLKREDRFSDHFSDLVQNICSVRFSYPLLLSIFCNAPRDMRKFPQKCHKIAGCYESTVYGSRPPITSKPDSSPPQRPDVDNITSQPWSDATCPCTTSLKCLLPLCHALFVEKGKTKY